MDNRNQISGDYIDWNNDFNYPLQWLYESQYARDAYQMWLFRVNKAMLGQPCRNLYQEEITSNLKKIGDPDQQRKYKESCKNMPEGRSFALKKAVDNRANQMAGGVETYNYQINDPYMIIDDDTEDLLSAKCEQDYVLNKMEILSSTFSRDLTKYGVAAVLVKYNPINDSNKVLRINPKNIWFDTKYSSTGCERFRGYSTMISWAHLKKMIEDNNDEVNLDIKAPDRSIVDDKGQINKEVKYNNRKIRTLNGLDIYVQDLNRLATSAQLQTNGTWDFGEYDHDLKMCYNLNWYKTFATDPKKKTNSGYNGDDVELTVIYDLDRKVEFKIINRRYVISANTKSFRRKIAFPITNPITGEIKIRIDDFCLDCPLKFQFEEQENRDTAPYPTSPLFALLDLHDELCALRAKRDHVSKILSILRIETNGADATSLRGVLNIMGVVLDDIQGDIGTINFDYNYDPIDTEIAYREQIIINLLHAYDQFDALQAMGDRASAAESGMALSAVAQGLTTHQNAIMQLYADIARQCIANRVAFSPRQEFPVINNGEYSAITIQQMALTATISVKSKLAKTINQKTTSANALSLLGTLKEILNPQGIAWFAEAAMMGTVPRKMASTFIKEQGASQEEVALATQQAQNQAEQLAQNQRMYEENPMPYEANNVMQSYSPEMVDQIIAGLGNPGAVETPTTDLTMAEQIDMPNQEGAYAVNLEGMTSENGSRFANPNGEI